MEKYKFTHQGKKIEVDIAVPESLEEAVETMGEWAVYDWFKAAYYEEQKKAAKGIKKRVKQTLKIRVDQLDVEALLLLRQKGLLD